MMTDAEKPAALTLLLMAAFADGDQSETERAAVRQVATSLDTGSVPGCDIWKLYSAVIGRRVDLATTAGQLTSRESRLLAYEMAVGVCDSDGPTNPAEQRFLAELRQALGLADSTEAAAIEPSAASLAAAAVPDMPAASVAPAALSAPVPAAPPASPAHAATVEPLVLNYAILNGALELLPQSLASMAIVPLQMKMVYRIGRLHGFTLDRGHIRDFVATAGVGLASQTVEGYARKLVGGLVGRALGGGMMGGLARGATRAGTGVALTFATTYALGHLAQHYYAGGRRMDTAVLKNTYTDLLSRGRSVFNTHAGAIEQRAASLTPAEVMNLVRQP